MNVGGCERVVPQKDTKENFNCFGWRIVGTPKLKKIRS
jgi:hypothetical protein